MSKSSINMAEAGRILRHLRGIMTRTGVARELGISYSALAFYESGQRTPSGRVMELLADYYHVRKEDIFLPVSTTESSKN